MKIINDVILLFAIFILTSSCGKEDYKRIESTTRYMGIYASPVFSEIELTEYKNMVYSTRPNFMGIQFTDDQFKNIELQQEQLDLHLDVVVPPNADIYALQPLVVFIHGGGFKQGSKNGPMEQLLSYASAGYVSATVNYRLTVDNDQSEELRTMAAYHALEDVQNAIRFLKVNAEMFHIDTTRVAVTGVSAGAGLTFGIALGADEIDELISDFEGISARVNVTFPTGATLTGDSLIDLSYLEPNATDAPIMFFHNQVVDPATGATWEDAVLTKNLIQNSGNECILIPQPANTHGVSLHIGGTYWEVMKPFMWRHLRLYELSNNSFSEMLE